jgi:hypothetical protein
LFFNAQFKKNDQAGHFQKRLASDALQVVSAYVSRLVQPEYIRIIYHAKGGISSRLTFFCQKRME